MEDQTSERRRLSRATNFRRPIIIGLAGTAIFAATLMGWAATAPIEGAALAAGKFVARGQNKRIQHYEGGIVSEIAVAEGDLVKQGDVILRLDTTQQEAELRRLSAEYDAALAYEARLLAERDRREEIEYPAELAARRGSEEPIATLMDDYEREFKSSLMARKNEMTILDQKIKAQGAQIAGYKAQLDATVTQLEIVDQELAVVEDLLTKGLITQERVFGMRRAKAKLLGDKGNFESTISKIDEEILQNRQEIEQLLNSSSEKAAKDLLELRVSAAKIVRDLVSTKDFLARSVVRSPVDGIVVTLHVHTIGGVLSEGGAIADIIPQPADLIAEVRVDPADIDRIHSGQAAGIRIPALHIPYSPLIDAKVEYVSADSLIDQDTGSSYYLARIGDIDMPSDIDQERLDPGMQVEAFIVTEPRTFAEYVLDPIWESFTRSFREK